MAKKLQITLKRSLIGRTPQQRATTQTLGLRKVNQVVIQPDNPAIRGMIDKIKHMVEVKEIEE